MIVVIVVLLVTIILWYGYILHLQHLCQQQIKALSQCPPIPPVQKSSPKSLLKIPIIISSEERLKGRSEYVNIVRNSLQTTINIHTLFQQRFLQHYFKRLYLDKSRRTTTSDSFVGNCGRGYERMNEPYQSYARIEAWLRDVDKQSGLESTHS
jgi:hypothetical protein